MVASQQEGPRFDSQIPSKNLFVGVLYVLTKSVWDFYRFPHGSKTCTFTLIGDSKLPPVRGNSVCVGLVMDQRALPGVFPVISLYVLEISINRPLRLSRYKAGTIQDIWTNSITGYSTEYGETGKTEMIHKVVLCFPFHLILYICSTQPLFPHRISRFFSRHDCTTCS